MQVSSNKEAEAFVTDKQCLICDEEAVTRLDALRHCSEVHLRTFYLCTLCRKHFPDIDGLKSHKLICELQQSIVPIKPERRLSSPSSRALLSMFNYKTCAYCLKTFKTIDEIRGHIELVHQITLYVCYQCAVPHVYKHLRSLKSHLKEQFSNDGDNIVSWNSIDFRWMCEVTIISQNDYRCKTTHWMHITHKIKSCYLAGISNGAGKTSVDLIDPLILVLRFSISFLSISLRSDATNNDIGR